MRAWTLGVALALGGCPSTEDDKADTDDAADTETVGGGVDSDDGGGTGGDTDTTGSGGSGGSGGTGDSSDTGTPSDADGDGVLDAVDACPGEDDDLDDDGSGAADCTENLLTNGQFRADGSGWIAETDVTVAASTTDANGDTASGSLAVTNGSGSVAPTLLGVQQCVTVAASTSYVVRTSYFLASGQGAIGAGAQMVVVPYTSTDCSTGELSPRVTAIGQTEDAWTELKTSVDSGLEAKSARIFLRVRKSGNDPATTASFDNAIVRLP